MSQLDGTGMKRLHREWRRRTDGRLALILDGVQNPFNIGSVVRTAAAHAVHKQENLTSTSAQPGAAGDDALNDEDLDDSKYRQPLLRHEDEEVAVITRNPFTIEAMQPVHLGAALLGFVLARYGIPGEGAPRFRAFRWG